jgi:dihydrofolate reductase
VSATVLFMSMSLDGFVAGPDEGPGNGLGGHRLHEWGLTGADADHKGSSGRLTGVNGKVLDELLATGAVACGRGTTFEPVGGWGGDHHDGVPIFVLTRREPDSETGRWPLVSYVPNVRTAMSQAKRAAGDRMCWSTASEPHSSHSLPASSTSWRSISSRCSSGQGRRLFRRAGSRAHRARAHPDPRGGGRCHPHALPGPALMSSVAPPREVLHGC